MPPSRSFRLVLLTAATLGVAALAWNRHLTVLDLALTNEQLRLEQAELRAELRAARLGGGFNVTLAPEPALPMPEYTETTPADEAPVALESDRDGRRGGRDDYLARMQDPRFQAAQQARSRALLDTRYADLFRRLNLPPAQLEQLKTLLVERDTVMSDVVTAAAGAGINPRESGGDIRQLMRRAQEDIDASIAQILGNDGFAQYQHHQQTFSQRSAVNQLEQRLSYTATPLTSAQSEQLINILARHTANRTASAITRPGQTGASSAASMGLNEQTLAQAAAILSPAQLEAFRELQAQSAAQRRPGRGMGGAPTPAVRLPGG